MISKNEVKYIQSLNHKKTRDKEGVFLAEGVKVVNELIKSDIVIKKIYATGEWLSNNKHIENAVAAEEFELDKISNFSNSNQVIAVAEKKQLKDEPQTSKKIILVLNSVQDPGNVGTIIRNADWFGVKQIITDSGTADIYNPKVVQASMGSIFRVGVWVKDLSGWLQKCTVPVYGALLHGTALPEIKKINEGVIIIGNESKGIQENLLPYISCAVTIPGKGEVDSLNAAVAAGIILSHIVK